MRAARTVEVTAVIDQAPVGRLQKTVLILIGLVAVFDGFDTQSIAFVVPAIALEWGLGLPTFGAVLGAGTLGLTLGAMAVGPFGDHVGRKLPLVAATTAVGLFSLLCASATSLPTMLIYRLIVGFGLGAAMPCIVALASEYAPARARASIVNAISCGFPLGAVIGGAISTQIIPAFGWRWVFVFGGILSLVIAPALLIWLPESLLYLATQQGGAGKALRILNRIDPAASYSEADHVTIHEESPRRLLLRHLFATGRLGTTLLLWVVLFANLVTLYFLVTWIPSVIQQAGLSPSRAILPAIALNAGGIAGGLVLGRIIDRSNPFVVLVPIYFLGAASVAMIGLTISLPIGALLIMAFVAGFAVLGAMFCMHPLAATSYPTAIRSTGLGWALGVGRIGSILGPVLGGMGLSAGWTATEVFLASAVPLVAAALGVIGLALLQHSCVGRPCLAREV